MTMEEIEEAKKLLESIIDFLDEEISKVIEETEIEVVNEVSVAEKVKCASGLLDG